MPSSPFPRLLAVLAAVSLLAAPLSVRAAEAEEPASKIVPALTAPAPLEQRPDPAQPYRAAMAGLKILGVTGEGAQALWQAQGAGLNGLLNQGQPTPEELSLLSLPNARPELLASYRDYAAQFPLLSPEEVVLTVNMGLNRPFYTAPAPIDDPDSLTVLVNKYNNLPADYVPQLEVLGADYGRGSLRPQAAAQFRAMADAARAEGLTLKSVSAYRSYATQRATYNRYLTQYSQTLVDTFSARPGHSEHQTGLALDINAASVKAHFEATPEFAWLQENCARFGFLLRYPQGKDAITGYRFEPWHYRYVGTEIATRCMEQGLTYEEYAAALPNTPAPVLTLDGHPLEGVELLALEGVLYLSPFRLAQALGWPVTQDRGAVILSPEGKSLTLFTGRTALGDRGLLRHAFPALNLDGVLYLTLDDLAAALGWQLTERAEELALTRAEG